MTTPRLLVAAVAGIAVLSVVPELGPVCVPIVLLALGELWLRALPAEALPPTGRLGLGVAAGLVSLPLVAIALYVAGVAIRARSLSIGLVVLALALDGVALLRFRAPADPRFARTIPAVLLPVVVALIVGGAASLAYVRMPHPPQPGYTSLALGGWASRIDRPVAFPPRGLDVPVRLSSAGEPTEIAPVRVRVGNLLAGPARRVTIAADSTRSVRVHVPAPPDGCLHRIEISVGAASTVFYGRGPAAC